MLTEKKEKKEKRKEGRKGNLYLSLL